MPLFGNGSAYDGVNHTGNVFVVGYGTFFEEVAAGGQGVVSVFEFDGVIFADGRLALCGRAARRGEAHDGFAGEAFFVVFNFNGVEGIYGESGSQRRNQGCGQKQGG